MDLSSQSPLLLAALLAVTFVITLPFGVWRSFTRKFTIQWWLAIHLVIPLIFVMRRWGGFSYYFIPLFLASTVLGQIIGGKLNRKSTPI
jgi:hypothetical protein